MTRRPDDLPSLVAVSAGLLLLAPGPGLTLALLGTGLFFAGAWISPRAGLIGVAATLPFYLFSRAIGGQSVSPTEAAILLTAAAVALRAIASRLGRPRIPGPSPLVPRPSPLAPRPSSFAPPAWGAFDGPIALLLASALLSLLATEYLRLSLRELRTLIVEPVLFWYLCRAVLRSPADVGRLILVLAAATVVVAGLGLVQLAAGGAVTDVQGVRRVQGTYSSPNHFALLLGRTIPYLLAAAWLLPRWRVPALIGGLLCLTALGATFSVGGWLATGLAVLVVVGLLGGRRPVAALVALGASTAVLVFVAAPVERLAGRFDPRQGTSFVRIQLWQVSAELIAEAPLLGIGLDNFLYRYPSRMPPGSSFEPNLSHPHNLILQCWLQLGLAGVAAVGWLLATMTRRLWDAARATGAPATGPPVARTLAVGALGSLTDFVAHGMVDNSYFLPDMAIIFWLTGAVAVVVSAAQPASGAAPPDERHGTVSPPRS